MQEKQWVFASRRKVLVMTSWDTSSMESCNDLFTERDKPDKPFTNVRACIWNARPFWDILSHTTGSDILNFKPGCLGMEVTFLCERVSWNLTDKTTTKSYLPQITCSSKVITRSGPFNKRGYISCYICCFQHTWLKKYLQNWCTLLFHKQTNFLSIAQNFKGGRWLHHAVGF